MKTLPLCIAALITLWPALAADAVKKTITITEGTSMALTASPDGKTILLGLHTGLWSLPITGGPARLLTDIVQDAVRPDWSPKGDAIAFQSYASGGFHIWIMKPDGSGARQLTNGHGDDREPRFSPDGGRIAFSSDRAFKGSYDIWSVEVATGKLTQWTSGAEDEYEPAWSPDGKEIAFVSGEGAAGTKISAVNAAGGQHVLVTAQGAAHVNSPSFASDGKRIAYTQVTGNTTRLMVSGAALGTRDDVFPFPPVWLASGDLLYTANGRICVTQASGTTREIPFEARIEIDRPGWRMKKFDFDSTANKQTKGIVGPALSPDGKKIVFQALNQLWLMEIGKAPQALTKDAFYKDSPAWSPDGSKLAYASDKAGTEDLYILDLATKQERHITTSVDSAEFSPAWSPDAKFLAFQDQTGATRILDLATGSARQIIPAQFEPSKPTWSHNGKTVSISAVKPYTRRFREGTSQILSANVDTGTLTYSEPAPFKSLSTRGEDGPVYSPDGSAMAYVMESVLWIRPVDANGIPAGEPRAITSEATDAPTWSGDSKRLLYLNNGKLRLVDAKGGTPQTVALDLPFHRDQPSGQILIHAARMWDGRGAAERTGVDIVIVNNRIRATEAHSDAAHRASGVRVIDASNLTVVPGLWESHTHQWMSGRNYGDRLGRLWLAWGVTALHSQGDPAYRTVETREAFDSGARLGPRFFATGEAVDGDRVYYNFMRPTSNGEAQLKLELSRAQALEYDSMKSYVRLTHAMQREVIAFAHNTLGVPLLTHYLMPGVTYGTDAMSHVAATSRYGFAFSRSPGGASYQDVRALLGTSGMFNVSTPFTSSALYAEDPKMVDDPRLLALNTPWDEKALRTKRDRAVQGGQDVTLDSLKKEIETVAAVIKAGGLMLAGTDSPIDNVATALHLNLRAQVKFGIAPWQALQTATLFPARAYGVEADLGTIEPGKLADLTLVEGDPLRNIKDAARVAGVMKNGRYYTIADLTAPFATGK